MPQSCPTRSDDVERDFRTFSYKTAARFPRFARLFWGLESECLSNNGCMNTNHAVPECPQTPGMISPLLVSSRQAAVMLGGLSLKMMYLLRRDGRLKAVKIGSRTMYDPADLREFINRQKGVSQ